MHLASWGLLRIGWPSSHQMYSGSDRLKRIIATLNLCRQSKPLASAQLSVKEGLKAMMYCTSCGSPNMQKLSFVYTSGFRDHRGTVVGVGRGLFVGRNRRTSQSRLSQIAAPPRPRSYAGVMVPWVVVGLLGLWLCSLVILGLNTRTNEGLQNPRRYPSELLIDLTPNGVLMLETIGIAIGVGYVAMLPLLLRGVQRYNRDVFSKAIQRWNASFMCQSCGMIVETPKHDLLAAKTG